MFDKRLMQICPESKKYIIGNIILQFLELVCNTIMIIMIAGTIQNLYRNELETTQLIFSATVIAVTIIARLFTSKYAVRMSYLASKTVKQKMREMIYGKLLKLGSKYREQVSTAELVPCLLD